QLAEAIKAINGSLDEAAATSRKSFADQELSLRGLGSDLTAIRERTQETDTLRTTVNTLPSLLSQPAPAVPVDPADPNAVPPAAAPPVGPPVSVAPPATPPTGGQSPTRMLES